MALANRRDSRSPPNSQKIFASSSAPVLFTKSAAVSGCRSSIRMSSGPSCWKLNPRPGESSCGELTPKSNNTPSQLAAGIQPPISAKLPRRISNRPANFSASRLAAASTAAPSRSHPDSHPVGELAARISAA
jgi:hypothetical protein